MIAAAPALREVRLYGRLGREFGRVFRLAVMTPAEAVQALCAVLPGFRQAFLGKDGRAGYHVYVGRGAARRDIGEGDAAAIVGAREPIRFVPVVAGAKRAGALQIVLAYVLYAAAAVAGLYGYYGAEIWLTNAGNAMLVSGVIQLLSPQRAGKSSSAANNLPSYAYDGPVNSPEQGGPVPLAYGRVITGSTVVSQGLSSTDLLWTPGSELPHQTLPPWERGRVIP